MRNLEQRARVLWIFLFVLCFIMSILFYRYNPFRRPSLRYLRLHHGYELEYHAVNALQSEEYLDSLKSNKDIIVDLKDIESGIIVIRDKQRPDDIAVKADAPNTWWWYDQWDLRIEDYNTSGIKIHMGGSGVTYRW